MVDRRLVFGDPADAGTRWAMDDAAGSTGGGNFVLARDLDGGGVLLRYNPTSGNFEPFAPVDLGGQNILDGSTTVYDAATDTVGDGTTSANHDSVNTDDLTVNSTQLEEIASFGPNRVIASFSVNVSDDESIVLVASTQFDASGFVKIRNEAAEGGVTAAFTKGSVNIFTSNGSWATSDSDGNFCLFVNSNNDLVFKNRSGGGYDFSINVDHV
jgi:hypothetical protein